MLARQMLYVVYSSFFSFFLFVSLFLLEIMFMMRLFQNLKTKKRLELFDKQDITLVYISTPVSKQRKLNNG